MLISVRTFEGKEIPLDVQSTDTIQSVKKSIQSKERIRIDLQRLMFDNRTLQNRRTLSSYGIGDGAILYVVLRAAQNSNTVAGGYGLGNANDELCYPYGLVIDDDQQSIIIADWGNHRILQWKINETNGHVKAGGHGQGNALNQLYCPTDVLIDKETNSLIICDRGNKRVVRWSRRDGTTEGEIIINNIACWGIAMDKDRYLYISDIEKHEVRQYQIGQQNGTLVAGGHGKGVGLDQLNWPTHLFVDEHYNVYVSDTWNYRVMKWTKNASEGIVVATGCPRGLYVDSSETIYMADYGNHQLICWSKEAKEGTVFAIGDGEKDGTNQLYYPWGLSIDQHGYLYVADHSSHRIQRFPLKKD
ncbi:unnamed protein product [Rotaria magnacalcarata]|uniref:Ubiquitin-like domain-containing protein n=2 Tax=Rotaria magnacalcarata TaxID=392030 RepID=A0A819R5F4_9BILA|nr:unnamed protein product [Rotaria magnacalcarata]CAF2121315.1 unnamed protein product [Rotaria magnacalcarata]CAF4035007.1 unnamed protein product [Rotaria magnacalcarata]CAF4457545.1 unnamed protein product [Rotaria magnacalcarata]